MLEPEQLDDSVIEKLRDYLGAQIEVIKAVVSRDKIEVEVECAAFREESDRLVESARGLRKNRPPSIRRIDAPGSVEAGPTQSACPDGSGRGLAGVREILRGDCGAGPRARSVAEPTTAQTARDARRMLSESRKNRLGDQVLRARADTGSSPIFRAPLTARIGKKAHDLRRRSARPTRRPRGPLPETSAKA